jgi:hypothetical protein
MRIPGSIKRLIRNERGNVLVIGAAMMPFMIGSAALALDTIQMSLWKRQLQRAADSAALAGAYAMVQGKDLPAAVARDLQLNNDVTLFGPVSVENAPLGGRFAGDPRAVRVVLRSQRAMPFMAFFDQTPATIQTEATAASVYQGEHCMVSLEETAVTGITFTGNTNLTLGCGIATNSKAAHAVTAEGSARIVATPVSAVGGVPASGGYVSPTTLLPYSLKQPDPYASLPRQPSPPPACRPAIDVQPNRTETIQNDGCFKGMNVQGTLNLAPGVYYIDGSGGGDFDLGATGRVNGTGVTIILTSSTPTSPSSFATVSIHGNAVVNLSSPESGPYKGVLFYQDPRSPYDETVINGNASSVLEGGFYFPSHQLRFNGNAGLQTKCIQMVALRLLFSGNSKVENDCSENGGGHGFDTTFVRLVA